MADDPTLATPPAATPPAMTEAAGEPAMTQPVPLQLTQARVPLDEAGEAFHRPGSLRSPADRGPAQAAVPHPE